MYHQDQHRHAIFCVLPPYILEAIIRNGSAAQRQEALQTLSVDSTMRAMRATSDLRYVRAQARAVEGQKQRTIFDNHNTYEPSVTLVRSEGQAAVADIAVNEAYEGLGATYDFFWDLFQRDSINDQGLPLDAVVHYGRGYANAFWDGSRMIFGDGDNLLFNRFTLCLDIIAHELAHGVTNYETRLIYLDQSGALNESLSDVWGSLVKQYALRQTVNQADWLIGAGLFTSQVNGVALRSMKAPGTAFDDALLGKDPQPGHMSQFVNTPGDHGGVHINSGIPNHAFYLLATKLGGFAWEKAGRIWYATIRNARVRPTTGFRGFARRTFTRAGLLFGEGSREQCAVKEAWGEVGIAVK